MGSIAGLDLGDFGIYTFDFEFQPAAQIRDSIQALEGQGWQSFWFPELLGRESFSHAGFLLSCTEQIRIVSAIAKIWVRPARWAQSSSVLLSDAYPDRYVVGLGFGGEPKAGTKPLTAMRDYLDEMDSFADPSPAPKSPSRRFLAAYGPKMIELARDRTDGVQVYHSNVEHTARAREVAGPDTFLAVEQTVLFERDPEKARAIAREHMDIYLTSPFNIAKFRRLGYSDEEIGNGGSDRIIDDYVFWGDQDTIVEKLQRHIAAGASHVSIQVIGLDPGESAVGHWQRLADALLS
ncbi:TIGR03620 family F420-dependent LLM class oxidoreductase [Nocardia sp. CA-290969]|uniref:TIGR03620 family F420-dependent LLM class oxidoreductase n=1 Tax=Nocardia sp. CA-290969 TaxID=3239986 RepID=UPI003D8ACFD8